ncbi:hypothetical protein LTR66_003672 [Elasticomyces elasticus]|nr:hypothetical protein LTR66_003672 [Elasticomyces elasticus]
MSFEQPCDDGCQISPAQVGDVDTLSKDSSRSITGPLHTNELPPFITTIVQQSGTHDRQPAAEMQGIQSESDLWRTREPSRDYTHGMESVETAENLQSPPVCTTLSEISVKIGRHDTAPNIMHDNQSVFGDRLAHQPTGAEQGLLCFNNDVEQDDSTLSKFPAARNPEAKNIVGATEAAPHGAHKHENLQQTPMSREDILRRVAIRGASGKIMKRSRLKRVVAPAPEPGQPHLHKSSTSSSIASVTANDLLTMLTAQVQREQQHAAQRADEECAKYKEQLHAASEERRHIEEELGRLQAEKGDHVSALQQYAKQLTAYQAKFAKLRKYMDGLGNDHVTLQREYKPLVGRCAELAQDLSNQKKETEAILQQMQTCIERCRKIKDDLNLCVREARHEVETALMSRRMTEAQLSEKVGLLAEERDRRTKLEKELADTKIEHERILRTIESNLERLMDQIRVISAATEVETGDKLMAAKLDQCLHGIKGLQSQKVASVENIQDVRASMTELSDSISTCVRELCELSSDDAKMDKRVDERVAAAVESIKMEFINHKELQTRVTGYCESIATFEERIKQKALIISDIESQLERSTRSNEVLIEKVKQLEIQIVTSQRPSSTMADSSAACEKEAEIETLRVQSERLKADLTEERKLVRMNAAAEEAIRNEVADLKRKLDEAQQIAEHFEQEKAAIEQKVKQDLDGVRNDLNKQANQLRAQQEANWGNTLHRVCQEKKKLEQKMDSITTEIEPLKHEIHRLQEQLVDKEEVIKTLSDTISSHEASTRDLEKAARNAGSLETKAGSYKEELESLSAELQSRDVLLQKAEEEQTLLREQLERLCQALKTAQYERQELDSQTKKQQESANAALDEVRNQNTSEKAELRHRLAAAEASRSDAVSAREKLRADAELAIRQQQDKNKRDLDVLHHRLSEAKEAAKEKEIAEQKQREEVETAFKQQQSLHRAQTAELQRRLTELRAEQGEIATDKAQQKSGLDSLCAQCKEVNDADEQATQHQRGNLEAMHRDCPENVPQSAAGSRPASNVPSDPLHKQQTPRVKTIDDEPRKTRKKVDRNSNTTIEIETLPISQPLVVPSELHSSLIRGGSHEKSDAARFLPATTSQRITATGRRNPQLQISCTQVASRTYSPALENAATADLNTQEMLAEEGESSYGLLETVPETQPQTPHLTFAAFNKSQGFATPSRPDLRSSSLSEIDLFPRSSAERLRTSDSSVVGCLNPHSQRDVTTNAHIGTHWSYKKPTAMSQELGSNDFISGRQELSDLEVVSYQMHSPQRETTQAFNFLARPHAIPNTASRMKPSQQLLPAPRPTADNTRQTASHQSQRQSLSPAIPSRGPSSGVIGTPYQVNRDQAKGNESSPAYVRETSTRLQKTTTYTRAPSRDGCAGMEHGQTDSQGSAIRMQLKRKASVSTDHNHDDHLHESSARSDYSAVTYEPERKRRTVQHAVHQSHAPSKQESHPETVSQAFSTMPSQRVTRSTSHIATPSQSHMRSSGGVTMQGSRVGKRHGTAKSDRYSLRFSQELR